MSSFFLLSSVTLLVFAAACAVSDCMTLKIPNTLILCGMCCALVSRAGECVFSSRPFLKMTADAAGGFLLPYLLLGGLVFLRMLGGGDVKLLSVIGFQIGSRGCLILIWYTILTAAAISAGMVIHRKNLAQRLEYLHGYVKRVLRTGRMIPYRDSSGTDPVNPACAGRSQQECPREHAGGSGEFAFAVPVCIALAVCLLKGAA